MSGEKLIAALESVKWDENVSNFVRQSAAVESVENSNKRLATWAKQFENADDENPALCFIREMQMAGHMVAACTALSLYKAAAGSIRSILEAALYYSFFRTHPAELTTLSREGGYYITKSEILDYHKMHTPDFFGLQKQVGLVSKLEDWYGGVSAIIHGQIPGKWLNQKSFNEIRTNVPTQDIVVKTFTSGVEIVSLFFLCTVGRELWDGFSHTGKKQLLTGVDGAIKTAVGLDSA